MTDESIDTASERRERRERRERQRRAMEAWLAANPEDETVDSASTHPVRPPAESASRVPTQHPASDSNTVTTLVRIGLAALAVAAFALWMGLAPGSDYDELRREVASRSEANNESAESALQQEVANGWETNDYLELITVQIEQGNDRRDALLGSILLAIVLVGSTSTSRTRNSA